MNQCYKLSCLDWNDRHVKFNVFDPKGANCGQLCVETENVFNFIRYSWKGHIFWNGKMPEEVVMTAPND